MHIVHLIDAVSDSGVTRVVLTLARAMTTAGHRVTVLTCRDGIDSAAASGLHLLRLPGLREPPRWQRRLLGARFAALVNAKSDSAVLDAWAGREHPDFVFIHGLSALRFHRLGYRHAIVAHSTKSKMLLPAAAVPWRPLWRSLYARVYRNRDIVAVSSGARDDLLREFGADPARVFCIHNPCDIERIAELAEAPVDDLPERPFFVAAGRAVRAKRFDLLVRAFARCDVNADLLILGQGRKFRRYARLARQLGVGGRVHFPGYRHNPYPYFRQARALVLSSDYEGFGNTLVESLACGTAVVSTDCPSGPREILGDRFREYLVPCGSVDDLADGMRRVFLAPYDYPRELLEGFSPSRVTEKYLEFIKDVVARD